MTAIVDYAIIQKVKDDINNWKDIFNEPKINLQNIALVSRRFNDVLSEALKFPSLKNYLNQLIKDLKQARFDELFEQLKEQSIEEYKGLSTEDLNESLVNILKKSVISKDAFERAVKLILAGAYVNAKDNMFGETALMFASKKGHKEIVEILQSLENQSL